MEIIMFGFSIAATARRGLVRLTLAPAVAFLIALSSAPAASARDAFDDLPTREVPGTQIGWFTNSLDAFVKAVEENKPLIVVFGDQTSPLSQAFAKYVASCPQLNQLAGVAVFAYGSPPADEYARRMAWHLKLTVYPTISVIAPRTDKLTEDYRMEGFFHAESIADSLQQALVSRNYWPKGVALPRKLATHYLAYPGKACTHEGVKRLGLDRK
jgi:hypothetical protein